MVHFPNNIALINYRVKGRVNGNVILNLIG